MFRPHPSPGPQWEALEEPTDSSSVEDEEERRSFGTGPFLGKRKETIRLESPKLKRAKHHIGEVGKLGSSSGIHDPGHAATRIASDVNHNACISQISQRESTQSSNMSASAVARPPPNLMGPPPVPNHSISTDGRLQSSTVRPKARPLPKPRSYDTAGLPSANEDFPSTLTDEVFNHSRRNSTDSNSTNTGGSKVDRDGRTAPHLARKSTGKGPPSSTLPIAKDKEVIEISDDSDEESAPQAKVVAPKRTLPKLPPLRAPGSLPSLPSAASRPTSSSSKDASRRSSTSNVSSHGDSSSRDESMSKPSPRSNQEASTSKSRRLSVTRQVAVKSSGQRRERRRQATSDEESGSAASRPHSRVTSVSSIDTRSLNEALGTSSSKGKEPSRSNTVSVKQQPVSPQMPKIGNASSAIDKSPKSKAAKKSNKQSEQSLKSLGDAIVAAAKSNYRLHSQIGTGESLDDAIDLTSDVEDEAPPIYKPVARKVTGSPKKPSSSTTRDARTGPSISTSSLPSTNLKGQQISSPLEPNQFPSGPATSSSPPLVSPSDASTSSSNASESEDGRPAPSARHSAPQGSVAKKGSLAGPLSPRRTEFLRPPLRPATTGLSVLSPAKKDDTSNRTTTIVNTFGDVSLPPSHPASPRVSPSPPAFIVPPILSLKDAAKGESSSSMESLETVKAKTGARQAVADVRGSTEPPSDVDMAVDPSPNGMEVQDNPQTEDVDDDDQEENEEEEVVDAVMEEDFYSSDGMVDPVPQTDTDEAELSFEAEDRPSSRVSTHSSASDSWLTTEQEAARNTSSPASRETTPEERTVGQPPSQKTYGGFAALTWKEYSRHPEYISLNPRYTKDLRPGLVDHVVEMTKVAETLITMPEMRTLYEAMILENTMNDEPEAPPIKIQNDVDDCAAPPWEFFYTNEMWHGEDVPAPEVKDLVGCSCKGACNPKSKSCTCLKRQAAVTGEMDFIYDKNGKLKRPGYPIYECNALCGCGDDCRNRVIQKGRKAHVHLRKTQYKGWGVFAGKRIPTGTFLGIYSGELISAKEAQRRGIAYNKFGRTYLFDLDFHHLRPQGPEADKWKPEFTVDAFKAGNFTRFLNHSCDPNTRLFPCYINEPEPRPLLAVFTTKDIDVNEEICFSYSGDYPEDEEDPEKTSADPVKLAAKADKKDKIYEECRCGAVNCKGYMFMYDSAAEDDDEDDDDDDSDSET